MKILNFGSLNIDYTYSVDHFVRAGETLSSGELKQFSGGKGLNQSIIIRRVKDPEEAGRRASVGILFLSLF